MTQKSKIFYHRLIVVVNENMGNLNIFSVLHKFNLFILYNIAYCKRRKYVLSYRYQEVINFLRLQTE